jgi:iron complex transport system substrate-binding protein
VTLAACGGTTPPPRTGTSPEASTPSGTTAPAASAPATDLANCGVRIPVGEPPVRVVTMNQAATEVMLALGLQDRMTGTAYVDDTVAPAFARAYASVPVLAAEYPSREVLLSRQPDFVYASYASAFEPAAAGTRASLASVGIRSYLSPFGCADAAQRPARVNLEGVFGEIADIGRLFGVSQRADALIAGQRTALAVATAGMATGKGQSVLWWDSETKAPFVGTCCGGPAMMLDAVGAHNVFAGVEGSWANVSWEQAVAADPDVVVLVDATWDTAAAKLSYASRSRALRDLRAFREHRVVELPFSDTTPGVRVVTGIQRLAASLRRLGVTLAP